jgi:hypothetical protein
MARKQVHHRITPMRLTAALLIVPSIGLGAFAWWGQYTVEGRTQYDEMDGLYPFDAGLLAGFLIVVALGFAWLGARQRARRQRQ